MMDGREKRVKQTFSGVQKLTLRLARKKLAFRKTNGTCLILKIDLILYSN